MDHREYLTIPIERLFVYLADPRPCRRRAAAALLCRITPWLDDLPPRVTEHARHPDPVVRELVLGALQQAGTPVPEPAPGAPLRPPFPAAPGDRWAAIAALPMVAWPELRGHLQSGDPDHLWPALLAFTNGLRDRWDAAGSEEAPVDVLAACLQGGEELCRALAIDALTALGGRSAPAAPQLTAMLIALPVESGDSVVSALFAIGQPAPDAVPAVLERIAWAAARLPEQEERLQMLHYKLRTLGRDVPAAGPPMIASARSGSPLARRYAVGTLGCLGEIGREAVPLLLELTHSDDPRLRDEAVTALGQAGVASDAVVDRLYEVLVTRRAAAPLKIAKAEPPPPPGTDPTIVEAALLFRKWADRNNDPGKDARAEAAEALAMLRVRRPEVVAELLAAARDPDDELRQHAVRALGRAGDASPAILEVLIGQMEDPHVGATAASALGELGPAASDALPALRHMQARSDGHGEWLRYFCDQAIAAIENRKPLELE